MGSSQVAVVMAKSDRCTTLCLPTRHRTRNSPRYPPIGTVLECLDGDH
jgi:hypothetical protein